MQSNSQDKIEKKMRHHSQSEKQVWHVLRCRTPSYRPQAQNCSWFDFRLARVHNCCVGHTQAHAGRKDFDESDAAWVHSHCYNEKSNVNPTHSSSILPQTIHIPSIGITTLLGLYAKIKQTVRIASIK